jgi:hypothetical protein
MAQPGEVWRQTEPRAFSSWDENEILIQQSELGSLATVTLRYMPDAESVTVTLIIPRRIWLKDPSEKVGMLAIKCRDVMTMLPPPGAAESYEAILVEGSVQSSIPK